MPQKTSYLEENISRSVQVLPSIVVLTHSLKSGGLFNSNYNLALLMRATLIIIQLYIQFILIYLFNKHFSIYYAYRPISEDMNNPNGCDGYSNLDLDQIVVALPSLHQFQFSLRIHRRWDLKDVSLYRMMLLDAMMDSESPINTHTTKQ